MLIRKLNKLAEEGIKEREIKNSIISFEYDEKAFEKEEETKEKALKR